MSVRNILYHSYAKKNKSRKKKYFVLSTYSNYSDPRLDYFINKEKWNENKQEIDNENSENKFYQSIDLSNLFFVDDIHRSKSKLKGLNLYMEDRHLTLIFLSDDLKKKWKEYCENIIYKNSNLKPFYKSNIEYVLEVTIRLKPKENIDKSVISQLQGSFRACFTKSSLMFVSTSLESPVLTIQYPFIRQWESRYDGTFRLEIGRAALIGECLLILQLADYEESKAAHSKLTNCINSFKLAKPDPPKVRNQCEKASKRSSLISCSSKPISFTNVNNEPIHKRHDSCITFGTESLIDSSSASLKLDCSTNGNPSCSADDSNYLLMNGYCDSSPNKSNNVLDYLEQTNRIYKCPNCGCFTKLIIYCSKCCSNVNLNTLNLLCKSDMNSDPKSFEIQPQLFEPSRNKAQSLTEKPNRLSSNCINKTKFPSDTSKPTASYNSKSSSKTSTNDASTSSKQESQNSLAISANRHDDQIFMELDFDNLAVRNFSTVKVSTNSRQSAQLKCANCQTNLIHKTPGDNAFDKRCSICLEDLVTLSIPLKDTVIGSDWRPRTTSLVPAIRPRLPINSIATSIINSSTKFKSNSHNEYVDVTSD